MLVLHFWANEWWEEGYLPWPTAHRDGLLHRVSQAKGLPEVLVPLTVLQMRKLRPRKKEKWLSKVAQLTQMPGWRSDAWPGGIASHLPSGPHTETTDPPKPDESAFIFSKWPEKWIQVKKSRVTLTHPNPLLATSYPVQWLYTQPRAHPHHPTHAHPHLTSVDLLGQVAYIPLGRTSTEPFQVQVLRRMTSQHSYQSVWLAIWSLECRAREQLGLGRLDLSP